MPVKRVAIGMVGPGLVGAEVLRQLEATKDILKANDMDVTVSCIADLKEGKPWMMCKESWISLDEAQKATYADGEAGDFEKMATYLKSIAPHAVIFDTTAAEPVSNMYASWLKKGCHVVTPNKKVGSGPLARYEECQSVVKNGDAIWGYEVTVGAGLPIMNILKKDLLQTGDKVKKVEGIFSGTLSYLFNTFKPGMKFSEVIADANSKGFTEPDPRDDLGGVDVARKVCIIARECGMKVELADIPIKSLVPEALANWKPKEGENMRDAFVTEMAKFDDEKTVLMQEAENKGMVLRFVGIIDVENKTCEVKLDMYPKSHSFAGTQWADNIVAFHTERYVPQPLVVQGPGAGAAVTAAGLYAELLKIVDQVH
mmetsp:Transcript_80320/g.117740  ORF Transcript_80320/g.117740 Transcript_80320/m.117740 type:complete len:370 (-) Transcript_80320:151-1260(-)|eukprot:CAMPEP_0179440232 /NCGR_PEP_ID=MMETSP0799-20121207/23823_1 /TAXON_ID=46947 /ORGANISM="Geminigera cryophila, Strain CCMP2564" /LENGTH=369 /DNA_ID=CAMNT_0021223359 /DNA_START=26 /DNA_END=1135 /DNA_ORIENTATION=+